MLSVIVLSKHLAIINQFWLVKSINRLNTYIEAMDRPTILPILYILFGECTTGRKLCLNTIFSHKVYPTYVHIWDSRIMLNFPMVVQSPYYV